MMIECAVMTDKGPVRENNEDNYFVDGHIATVSASQSGYRMSSLCMREICHDIAIFDGMGGEDYGEIASSTAVRILADFFARRRGGMFEDYTRAANEAILRETAELGAVHMGTTAVMLHISGEEASLCNIGDSRAYVMRYGRLNQISQDHKVFDKAAGANMLTQHLGIDPDDFVIEPYILRNIRLEPGMMFVLCTDGLTDTVSNPELQSILADNSTMPVQQVASLLIRSALAKKTLDNITVAVVKVY